MVEDQNDLTARVERLERVGRWYQSAGLVGLCIVGAVVWLGAATTRNVEEVRVRRVVIVDEAGAVRMTVGMEVGTLGVGPVVRLSDAKGTNRAELLVRGDGAPFLTLRDSEGKTTAQLDVSGAGLDPSAADFGGLSLQGPRRGLGSPRAEITLGFKSADEPQMRMERRDGVVVWRAP